MSAELILATATAMEMRAALRGLGHGYIPDHSPEAGLPVFLHNGRIIRPVITGVGPLTASFGMGKLAGEGSLSPERCRGILLLGIAGTYDTAMAPLGSIVVACEEIWPEYGIVTSEGVDPRPLAFRSWAAKTP